VTIDVQLKKRRGAFALDVAFSVRGPGLVALFGPSGSGKTTIVNLIAGLIAPDEGCVRLGGTTLYDSVAGIDVPVEARRIGYVFQDARLFPHLDVRGNLLYGAKRVGAATAPGELAEIVALLGIEALLERRPRGLSGGERQRVALGRALLCRPRVLLLDEPLAALDLARREDLLPYLERLRDRLSIPIVYVSHQFEEVVRLATHVVVLRAGKVVAQGDIAAVSLTAPLREMVGSEGLGAVIEGEIEALEPDTGLARLRVGTGRLKIQSEGIALTGLVRVQLLARDLILAVEPPRGLSVRNALAGTLASIVADSDRTHLVEVDIGGPKLLAQVTASASSELGLSVGRPIWVLVKTVSLRGHVYPAGPTREPPPAAPSAPGGAAAPHETWADAPPP